MPFCLNIKQKFKQQQANNRKKQAAMLRRRMQAMIGPQGGAMGSTPPSGNHANGANKLPHSNSQSSLGKCVGCCLLSFYFDFVVFDDSPKIWEFP